MALLRVLDEKDATCGSPRVRRSLELGVGRHTCGRELLPPPADKRISRTQLHIDVAHDSKVVVRREGQNPSFVLSVGSEVPVELEKGVPHHLLPGSVIWLSRRPVSSLLIHPIDIVPCSVPAHPIAILPQEGEAPDASRAPLNARFEDPRPPVWEVMLGGTFKAYEPSVQRQLEEAYGVDLPEVEIKVRGEDYVIDLREKRQMPKFNRAKARQVRRRTSTSAQAREKAVHEGVGGGEIEKGMQARKEGRVIEDGCTTGGGEKVHVMNEGNKEGTVLESDIETMPTGADQNRTSEERKGKSCTMEGDARDRATEGGGREIAIEGHVTKSEVESGMLTRTMGVHGATSTMDVDRTRSMIDPVGEKECPRVGTLEGEEVVDRAHSSSKQKKKRSLAEMLAQQEAEVSALLADSSPSKLKETTGEAPTPGLFEGGHDTTSPLTPSPPGGGSCSMSGERSAEMPAPGLIESWHQLPAPPPPSELVKGHVQTRLFADDPSAGERTLAFPLLCAATDCQFDHEVALRVGVEEVRRFLEQHAADKLTLLLTERSGSLEEAFMSRIRALPELKDDPRIQSLSIPDLSRLRTLTAGKHLARFVANTANTKLSARGCGLNKKLHLVGGEELERATKESWPPCAKPGLAYPVLLPETCPLRDEGFEWVIHVNCPNMNRARPLCLDGNYNLGAAQLAETYRSLFKAFYQRLGTSS